MVGTASVPDTVQFAALVTVVDVTFWLNVKLIANASSPTVSIVACTTARSFSVAKFAGSGTIDVTALTQAFAMFV